MFDGVRWSHFIFKRPFSRSSLDPEFEQQAAWVIRNHHCIKWEEGFTPFYLLPKILQRLTEGYTEIYVKGREKSEYIRKFVKVPVVEIEEQPALSPMKVSCFHHTETNCFCSLSIVYFLYNMYILQCDQ